MLGDAIASRGRLSARAILGTPVAEEAGAEPERETMTQR
jgi:hypothetical protein